MSLLVALALVAVAADPPPAAWPKPIRVAKSGTHLETADGKPFFFLADTCWTGPALSTEGDWQVYLKDRVAKKFTAIQFNVVSPWRTAPTDAEGNAAYTLDGGKLTPNAKFFDRVEARMKATLDAGLLPVPVLAWAHKKGDAGFDLSEEQLVTLIGYELGRLAKYPALWILAGDSNYNAEQAAKWKRIGRAVFKDYPDLVATTHPTGENFPWKSWEQEPWLKVLGYQSGHGDGADTLKFLHSGPPAEYGRRKTFTRPVIDLEPAYEGHKAYQSREPFSDFKVRRAIYWGLLTHPPAGVTYGGHGVWSWHTKPGKGPTDHESTGVAKVWREALDLPGAKQMAVVREVFEGLPWTELRPAPELVKEQPGKAEPANFIAAAATPDGQAFIIYIAGKQIGLDKLAAAVGGADGKRVLTFIDPSTGRKFDATLTDALAAQKLAGPGGDAEADLLVVYDGRKGAKK